MTKKKQSKFAERVNKIVREIPKGKAMSYGEVAKRSGNPNAARAVGRLMRLNYDASVPCHRVIKSDGSLGGYNRGGISRKRAILRNEGVLLRD